MRKVADAIGAFYERDSAGDPPSGGAGGEVATAEVVPIVPSLGFSELVAALYGSHAVAPWIDLAGPLTRRGWHVAATLVGEANLWLEWSPFLHADVSVLGPTHSPSFSITKTYAGEPEPDYETWIFASTTELLALVERFEGDLEVREPDVGQTAGRYWVMEDA